VAEGSFSSLQEMKKIIANKIKPHLMPYVLKVQECDATVFG
jgi:hypothetical protein